MKEKIKIFIKENPALSITLVNLFFLVLLLFSKDPFGILEKNYSKADPFFKMKENEVTKIIVEKNGIPESRQEISKTEKGFSVKEHDGKALPADPEKIQQLIKAVLGAKKFTAVSSEKGKDGEYGFGQDAISVELFGSDGTSKGTLLIGSVTARGVYTHAKLKDSDMVYLAEENLKTPVGRGEKGFFINKKLTPFGISPEEYNSLTVNSQGKGFSVLKDKDREWNLASPINGRASKEEIVSLLNRLNDLRAVDLVQDPNELKKIPQANGSIKATFKDKIGKSGEFTILVLAKDKSDYYTRLDGESVIYKVSHHLLDAFLDKNAEQILHKDDTIK